MKKILVLDDDNIFIAHVIAILDPKKYEVTFASNGVEGLKKLEALTPDGMLVDINMPEMDGLEFLKRVNEKFGHGTIPTLITSNLDGINPISEGVTLGIRGYIVKSKESLESLALAVENLVKNETKKG